VIKSAVFNTLTFLGPFLWFGRISRRSWWLVTICVVTLTLLGEHIVPFGSSAALIGAIILTYTLIIAHVKRWHDLGDSGLMMLLGFIPIVNFWVLYQLGFRPSMVGPNKYGEDPYKDPVDKMFNQGVSLLKNGELQQALTTFNQALGTAKSNRDKASILGNIAVCHLRLGEKDAAIRVLSDAVHFRRSVKAQIAKDKDFIELHNDERFRAL